MLLAMSARLIDQNLYRSLPHGLRSVVGDLEIRDATIVSDDVIAQSAGISPGTPEAYNLIHRLVSARWLRPLPVRGQYEFLPGRAGPFSRNDPLDPLRAMLAERPVQLQVALSGAAFLRGFSDRPPMAWDVLAPRGHRIALGLQDLYRFHWVAAKRIFGADNIQGVPASIPERLLIDVAMWPSVVGTALRLRDHWLARALSAASPEAVVAMLVGLASPTVTARAGYLAAAFDHPALADAIASLGRSAVAVPLLPGYAETSGRKPDRRFNVLDPVGAGATA